MPEFDPKQPALKEALEVARLLAESMAIEIERTRRAQGVLARLNAEQLFAYASGRDAFHAQTAALEARLAQALSSAGKRLGLAEVTMPALAARAPADTHALAEAFADIRKRAALLDELNKLHRELLERSLACVSAYLNLLQPRVKAYDRRGAAGPASEGSSFSRRV